MVKTICTFFWPSFLNTQFFSIFSRHPMLKYAFTSAPVFMGLRGSLAGVLSAEDLASATGSRGWHPELALHWSHLFAGTRMFRPSLFGQGRPYRRPREASPKWLKHPSWSHDKSGADRAPASGRLPGPFSTTGS